MSARPSVLARPLSTAALLVLGLAAITGLVATFGGGPLAAPSQRCSST